jgi:hypothetical protein
MPAHRHEMPAAIFSGPPGTLYDRREETASLNTFGGWHVLFFDYLGRMNMAHFDSWHWADFVRGLCDEPTQLAMQAHLSSGCPSCQRTVGTLRAIVVAAKGEVAVAPPEYAVRHAQAVYSNPRPETKLQRLVARLVYDSAREPLPAGIRAGERVSRRALFAAGDHQVDLQLDRQPTSDLVTLVGQVVGRQPGSGLADVPVWLMERDGLVQRTTCNSFGEFHLEYEPRRNLRLLFSLEEVGKRLEIALDHLIRGRKPPSARSTRRKPRSRG